jgi:hypothetical protein
MSFTASTLAFTPAPATDVPLQAAWSLLTRRQARGGRVATVGARNEAGAPPSGAHAAAKA